MKDRRGSSISSYELSVKNKMNADTQQKESRIIKRGDSEDEDKINFNEYLLVCECVLSPPPLSLYVYLIHFSFAGGFTMFDSSNHFSKVELNDVGGVLYSFDCTFSTPTNSRCCCR